MDGVRSLTERLVAAADLHPPEQVAAEDEAEHEDEEADAQHNHVDVEREVVDF